VAVLVLLVAALTAGLFFFSTDVRERVARMLNPTAPSSETATTAETATPADPATSRESAAEEPTRAAASAPDPTPATPAPSARASEIPLPVMPAPVVPPATTPTPAAREAAPAEPAAPAPSAPPSLPPRRSETPATDRTPDPAPPATRSQRLPEFPGLPRVEVSRAAGADSTTFTVRLTDPRGRPLPDAQVWLRQKSTDGFVRETPLEPVSPAGSYRGAVPGAAKRADVLTVRVVLGDRRMEMPVAE
jgi:hypothetical protein